MASTSPKMTTSASPLRSKLIKLIRRALADPVLVTVSEENCTSGYDIPYKVEGGVIVEDDCVTFLCRSFHLIFISKKNMHY